MVWIAWSFCSLDHRSSTPWRDDVGSLHDFPWKSRQDAFFDVEGGPLSYTAARADGSALPGWLHFEASTRMFSGQPENSDVGEVFVEVTATNPGGDSASDTFSIRVDNVNDPPTLSRVDTLGGAEEDRPFTITYAALLAAADEEDIDGDPVLFRVESVGSGVLTKDSEPVTAGVTTLAAGESLIWTPSAGASGVLEALPVRAWDGQASSATAVPVNVEVRPINDAPSFVSGADQEVGEDAGPQTVAGWASGISPGPADEAGQILQFVLTTDNDALFAALPAIDIQNGNLTYTPAANAFGTATVMVQLQDALRAEAIVRQLDPSRRDRMNCRPIRL